MDATPEFNCAFFSDAMGGSLVEHKPYSYVSADDFFVDTAKLKDGIPFSENTSVLGKEIIIDNRKIKNRLTAQPIEGFDSRENGAPSHRAMERYAKLAQGGSGMIWLESISVNREGKSSSHQMWITPDNVTAFAKLIGEIKEHGQPYIVAQLTHSGRNSNPDGKGMAICAFDNPAIPRTNFRIISDEQLKQLGRDYVAAIVLAEDAGFDAVDIRACHGYLLNELFAAHDRPGKYGGSYENRTRLIKEIISAARKATGITLAVRLNVMDGLPYPYGWGCDRDDTHKQDMTEPLRLVKELEQLGVSIINVSAGIGAVTPYMIRPYDRGGNIPSEHPLEGVERLLQSARQVKEAAPSVRVVASGFTWLRDFAPMVAAGGIEAGWYDFAGFGREWVAYPDYANDIVSKRKIKIQCTTCGGCTGLIKSGKEVRCVIAKT